MKTKMKPILFNNEMVRAILDGSKTVTRQAVKGANSEWSYIGLSDNMSLITSDRYGMEKGKPVKCLWATFERWAGYTDYPRFKGRYQPGDILYVRETWKQATIDPAGGGYALQDIYLYKADEPINTTGMLVEGRWHQSINMPREAARIFLLVTDVRVERLQDITEDEARKEGAQPVIVSTDPQDTPKNERTWHEWFPALPRFIEIWNSTIKPKDRDKYGWDANPWVWAISFKRISKEEAIDYA